MKIVSSKKMHKLLFLNLFVWPILSEIMFPSKSFVPKERKLMGLPYPLVEGKPGKIGALNLPQIDAPRMVINNFPKPGYHTQQYPREHIVNTENRPAPLSVFAPMDVPMQESIDLAAAEEEQGGSKKSKSRTPKKRQSPKIRSKRDRKLKQKPRKLNRPYFDFGKGFFEFGNNGYSPLSYALLNPKMASMSPFVPRRHEPVPIRIRLQNFKKETFEKNLLTRNETKLYKKETKYLERQLVKEFESLTEKLKEAETGLPDTLNEIEMKAHKFFETNKLSEDGAHLVQVAIDKKAEKNKLDQKKQTLLKVIQDIDSLPSFERKLNDHEPKQKPNFSSKSKSQKDRSLKQSLRNEHKFTQNQVSNIKQPSAFGINLNKRDVSYHLKI